MNLSDHWDTTAKVIDKEEGHVFTLYWIEYISIHEFGILKLEKIIFCRKIACMFVHVCQGHCFRACQRERAQGGFALFTRVCVITQGPLCICLHKAWSSHLDLTLLS